MTELVVDLSWKLGRGVGNFSLWEPSSIRKKFTNSRQLGNTQKRNNGQIPVCEVRRKKSLEVTDQQVWESESEEKAQIQEIRGNCPEKKSWPNGLVCKAQGRKVLKSQIQVWESESEEKT